MRYRKIMLSSFFLLFLTLGTVWISKACEDQEVKLEKKRLKVSAEPINYSLLITESLLRF